MGSSIVAELLEMPLAEFRGQAQELYGSKLYTQLTAVPPLSELDAGTQARWNRLLSVVAGMTVRQAIVAIQSFVISNFKYRYFDSIETTLLEELFERCGRGKARGSHEYLQLVTRLGGGRCKELSLLGLDLLRRAGIPAVMEMGYKADGREVPIIGHAWPNAVFPVGGGDACSWRAVPVEVSGDRMLEGEVATFENIAESLDLGPEAKDEKAKQPAAESAPETPSLVESLLPEAASEDQPTLANLLDLYLTAAGIDGPLDDTELPGFLLSQWSVLATVRGAQVPRSFPSPLPARAGVDARLRLLQVRFGEAGLTNVVPFLRYGLSL